MGWGWGWGQLGGYCAGAGVGDGGLAIYIQPRQPVTVKFQSRQETEWVRETLYEPGLILRNPELVSYPTVRCIGRHYSRLYLGRQIPSLTFPELFRFTVFLGPEYFGAPPPLLAVLQEAELSLGLAVGGGAEGSVSPHPTPQLRFLLGDRLCRQQQPPLPPPLTPLTTIPPLPLGMVLSPC